MRNPVNLGELFTAVLDLYALQKGSRSFAVTVASAAGCAFDVSHVSLGTGAYAAQGKSTAASERSKHFWMR